jgi:lipid A 3-O-deacylase
MKKIYKILLPIFFISCTTKEFAQSKDSKEPTKLFRIFEDEDFLNITGHGTDKAYSNGTRLDFFYEKKHESTFFLDRLMPKAGNSSKNIYGWSLMQIMVTPTKISVKEYQPNDYAYAGALFGVHSLYSYNPQKKYALQTEVVAGVRGPGSLAREVQTGFHRLISYQKPMGWDNQLSTIPLLNINFTAEKQFLSIGDFLEINGGTRIKAGSLMDAVILYPMIRIGKMSPYFDGYFNQFGSFKRNGKTVRRQYYFVIKPSQSFIAHHGLVQGKRENENNDEAKFNLIESNIEHRVSEIQFGAVLAQGNFSMCYMHCYTSEY